jgi:hypothetical protein
MSILLNKGKWDLRCTHVIKQLKNMRHQRDVLHWWGDPRETDHLEDPGVDGRIILKWIFKKWDGAWTGLIWLRIGTGGGLYECGKEPSGSIKSWEFLD